uniref:Cadherin domain-containing protein n=1 Tax=Cyprinus carpio TaxID=7962 RepID=A0A8C1X5J1_CYPCA
FFQCWFWLSDHVPLVCVQGANALVTYSIISGADDSFRIDPESGELTNTRRLDRERRSEYSLLVRADDGQQSSDVRLNITVSDVNDHTPHFSRAVYSFDIPEDTSAGTSPSPSPAGTTTEHTLFLKTLLLQTMLHCIQPQK